VSPREGQTTGGGGARLPCRRERGAEIGARSGDGGSVTPDRAGPQRRPATASRWGGKALRPGGAAVPPDRTAELAHASASQLFFHDVEPRADFGVAAL